MREYQCNACEIRICTAEYQDGGGVPCKCTGISDVYYKPQWKEIERPAKLPAWCKVGGFVWFDDWYFEITEIHLSDNLIGFKNIVTGIRGSHTSSYFLDHFKKARVRPWTFEEAPFNIKVKMPAGKLHLLRLHIEDSGNFFYRDESCHDMRAKEVAESYIQLDGKPCGVLEHLEKGEWER